MLYDVGFTTDVDDVTRYTVTVHGFSDRPQFVGEDANGGVYELGGSHYRGDGRLHYDWSTYYASDSYQPALGYYYDQGTYGALERVDSVFKAAGEG